MPSNASFACPVTRIALIFGYADIPDYYLKALVYFLAAA